jgi:tetratricopeptide (TPR) repeat protein
VIASVALAIGLAGTADPVAEAERLAAAAMRTAPASPEAALADARRALGLTGNFDPTAFVRAGRKGEVVEDAYLAARGEYRRHRAGLYEAVGVCLAAQGRHLPASRYLRRAVALEATPERVLALARALLALGQGRAALDALEKAVVEGALGSQAAALAAQAADAAALPSAQVEIDRWRLAVLAKERVRFRDGPITLSSSVRLSTTPVFRMDEAPVTLFYGAERSCRSCSSDLQDLRRTVRPGVRVVAVPEVEGQDHALRQVLGLYRSQWPVLMGRDLFPALGLAPRDALIVARGGWSAAEVKPPFGPGLTAALAVFEKTDVSESIPRSGWNRRSVVRTPPAPPPAVLPDGLVPGEDEPAPAEFTTAVEAYRAGRPAEALRLFEALEAKGDGWLLPPEARLDRGLALAAMGRRDEARRLLLRTGDSRVQDAVDRALEIVGSPPKRSR